MNNAFYRSGNGNLADLAGSIGWKGTGIFLLVIIIGFEVASIFL